MADERKYTVGQRVRLIVEVINGSSMSALLHKGAEGVVKQVYSEPEYSDTYDVIFDGRGLWNVDADEIEAVASDITPADYAADVLRSEGE